MTNLNLLMILLSFALLLLCMLAPLRKSAAVQKCPSLKMLFKPHGIRTPADRFFPPWDPLRK